MVIAAAHTAALAADNLDDAFVGAPFDHGRGLLGRYGLEDLGAGMLKDFLLMGVAVAFGADRFAVARHTDVAALA